MVKITIEGKEYTLLFGFTSYKLFMTGLWKFKSEYLENGELTRLGLAKLFHAAYIDACMDQNEAPELQYNDIASWVDLQYQSEEGLKIVANLCKIWSDSKEVKNLVEEREKKNLTLQSPIST